MLDVTAERGAGSDIGTLAYVSHEVRTPLTGILGLAEALSQSPLTAEQRAVVDALSEAGSSLLHMVNNMLEASRKGAAAPALDAAPFQLGALCSATTRLFSHRAAAKGLELGCGGGPEDPVLVGDQARLRQVLSNLISNAIKFTERGGVAVAWAVEPPAADGRRRMRLTVSDTGVGMSPEFAAEVFEPYRTSGAGLAHDHAGAGLGLSISRDIMRMLDGGISVESAPGAGSRFLVECDLPEARRVAGASGGPGAAGGSGAAGGACALRGPIAADREFLERMRPEILVADDVEANRRVVDLLLSPVGARVTCVDNGVDAVALAATRRFDAILLDGRMPGLAGVDATLEIRRLEGCESHPPSAIIAMSADAAELAEASFVMAGADAYLQKPFEPGGLIRAVAAALRARQAGGWKANGRQASAWQASGSPARAAPRPLAAVRA
ncbi:ATP-binding protein [Rubrimonas cliftonensis]|uniref:ATP-binding protein n=1 Tax=Rubrimonas cliftonensis TaxID=89524 RepID=UPI0015873819|nr:ATP-binding protein [Rubrimonas cliftonensis]